MVTANILGPTAPRCRADREIKASLARLEKENTAVRRELDRIRHSKASRLILILTHPLWTIRAATYSLLGWKWLVALREMWAEFGRQRLSLSSVTMSVTERTGTPPASAVARWNPELRIAGEQHESLLCDANSRVTLNARIGSHARLRAFFAVLPGAWDTLDQPVEFRATVHVAGGPRPFERSVTHVLNPALRWRDRRWHTIEIGISMPEEGEATITLETHSGSSSRSRVPVAWGDFALDWPRSPSARIRLVRVAARRLLQSGPRGIVTYALGRRRAGDRADAYARWVALNTPDERALRVLAEVTRTLPIQPRISVITPVYNTPPHVLKACLESVRRQIYSEWEHCIVDDASTSEATRTVLAQHAEDPRVRLVTLDRNQHVSIATNEALARATGDYVALLDHDDELPPEALAEVVRSLNAHPDTDVIYSDEDKLDERGVRCDPFFKPDWSPELFLSYMYACHLLVLRRRIVDAVGGFREGFEGAQDYDLLLRVMQRTDRIHHIPRVLYHWRKGEGSTATAASTKPWALEAGRRALEDYGRRAGLDAEVMSGPHPGMYRVRRKVTGEPLVSVIIPTTGRSADSTDLLAHCLRSLHRTSWSHFEVVLASDNRSLSDSVLAELRHLRHTIVDYSGRGRFNFAQKINEAARHARGDHLLLLNDDVEVVAPEWLTSMLEYSQDPAVGAVGAKLLYPDGRLQHVGMLIGVCGVAAHAFHRYPGGDSGYAGSAVVARNCSAVTAACLLTRRTVFDELGGLIEAFPVDFNDVDFCLRVRMAGYRIVFTPYAQLIHHESASIGARVNSSAELARMREKWGMALEHDPYYNPNLSRLFSDYRLKV